MFCGLLAGFAVNANLKELAPGIDEAAAVAAVGWFALANAAIYQQTKEDKYLRRAKVVADWNWRHRHPRTDLVPDAPSTGDRYDAEIRYTDFALGTLMEELKRRGLWENSLVVFTADHGESMGTHGLYFKHVVHVWEETVRVPLVIRFPGGAPGKGERIPHVCSELDLMPTVLHWLDGSTRTDLDGVSLLPMMTEGAPPPAERYILVEYPNPKAKR